MWRLLWGRLGIFGATLWAGLYLIFELFKGGVVSWANDQIARWAKDPTIPSLSLEEARIIGAALALAVAIVVIVGAFFVGRKFSGSDANWWERDQLEIYVIANLSDGRKPYAEDLSDGAVLTRLRLLKDEIGLGKLAARIQGASPNVWATVTLADFKKFAEARSHPEFNSVAEKWESRGKRRPPPAPADRETRITRHTLRAISIPDTAMKALSVAFQAATGISIRLNPVRLTRMRLAALRTAGVEIRNRNVKKHELQVWIEEVTEWDEAVRKEIEKVDPADAEDFRTLDTVPPPRVRPASTELLNDPTYLKHFREHDHRLVKLKALIDDYRLKQS